MKKILYIIPVSVLLVFSFQSCECPCENEVVSNYVCSPREATINRFNSDIATVDPNNDILVENGRISNINYYPDTAYSIHTFQFPNNLRSSGSLPNDERFIAQRGVSQIPLVKIEMSEYGFNAPYYFAVLTPYPPNEDMKGDILVEYAETAINSPNSPFADLRFAGDLAKISSNAFTSEASRDFCDYLESNNITDEGNIISFRNSLSEYGRNVPNSVENIPQYAQEDIVIVNSANQIVAINNNGNWEVVNYNVSGTDYYVLNENPLAQLRGIFPQIDLNEVYQDLLQKDNTENVTVRAGIGDVFFYRSVKGRDFVFAVINIDERDFGVAYKKRVSIMFNEL